eukprot:m.113148 g.113148  ORF g.113148 m.113148 type:complete len:62 (-) comp15438_c0_seq6:461-646(-)
MALAEDAAFACMQAMQAPVQLVILHEMFELDDGLVSSILVKWSYILNVHQVLDSVIDHTWK